jgi:hypothetical protein
MIIDHISRLPLNWQRRSVRINAFSEFDSVHLHAECISWSRTVELDWLYHCVEFRRLVWRLGESVRGLLQSLQFTPLFSLYFLIYSGLEVIMCPSISALDRARRTLLWSIFGLIQAYAWSNRSWKYSNRLLGYPTWLSNPSITAQF